MLDCAIVYEAKLFQNSYPERRALLNTSVRLLLLLVTLQLLRLLLILVLPLLLLLLVLQQVLQLQQLLLLSTVCSYAAKES
jgi:hypothetical protein